MKISVLAKPASKKKYVKKTDAGVYIISVKEKPVGGAANRVIIVKGFKSRRKIIEIKSKVRG